MHCVFPRKSQSCILLYVKHKSHACFRNVGVPSPHFPMGKEMPRRLNHHKKALLVCVVLCSFLTASYTVMCFCSCGVKLKLTFLNGLAYYSKTTSKRAVFLFHVFPGLSY